MKTKKLIMSALFIALATILSLIKLLELPFGGSVTAASMLPIILIAYIFGTRYGVFAAFVYSLLQLGLGLATGIVSKMFLPGNEGMALYKAVLICVLDYILAGTAPGLGGVFKNKLGCASAEIALGAVFALFVCWIMHTLSGFIFYGAWAEWFFADETGLGQIAAVRPFCEWVMTNCGGAVPALLYSVIYNGAYMLPETVITALLSPVMLRAVKRSGVV